MYQGELQTVFEPGWYPEGLLFDSNLTYTLSPGVYICGNPDGTGGGLVIKGESNVIAEWCQFYVNGSSTIESIDGPRSVYIAGTGTVIISAPGDNPINYVDGAPVVDGAMGVSIWQADNNHVDAHLAGTADGSSVGGCLYFPENRVDLAGGNFQAGNQLIADRLLMRGNGEVYINYDGRNAGVVQCKSALVK